jgi:hypothetical protein
MYKQNNNGGHQHNASALVGGGDKFKDNFGKKPVINFNIPQSMDGASSGK